MVALLENIDVMKNDMNVSSYGKMMVAHKIYIKIESKASSMKTDAESGVVCLNEYRCCKNYFVRVWTDFSGVAAVQCFLNHLVTTHTGSSPDGSDIVEKYPDPSFG